MDRPLKILLVLGVLGFALPAAHSGATTVIPFDTRQLAERAQAIVIGVCEAKESRTDPQMGSWIFTYTRFRVTQVIKGKTEGDSVTLRLPGGSTADVSSPVAGIPSFEVGEEAVLFLTRPGASGLPGLVGVEQGSFPIRTSATSGEKTVRGVTGSHPKGVQEAVRLRGNTSARSLDGFVQEIRGYMR